jgi:recombination protein RecA
MGMKMDALIKEINKDAKEEVMFKGLAHYNYEKIPFTSPRLNYNTRGGIPVERITELYGDEYGGKTTLALDLTANFQSIERKNEEQDDNYKAKSVFYCDVENSLNTEWAELLGVDIDSMYLFQPKERQSAENIFDIIEAAIKTDDIGFVVIDSIASLVSAAELDPKKTYEDKTYGGASGPISRFSNRITGLLPKYHCTVLGINQERDIINSQHGGKRTPGGRAWKYACSLRINVGKGIYIDDKGKDLPSYVESPYGMKIQTLITKIKTGAPDRRSGFCTLKFSEGIDYLNDLVDICVNKFGLIEKNGAWYVIPGIDQKFQGADKVYDYLDEHSEVLEELEKQLEEKIME